MEPITRFDATKITPQIIEDAIERCDFIRHEPVPELTICVLKLRNGFAVVGKSGCVDPANYDREIGERVAREDAVDKVWELMGFALKDRMAGGA